MVASSSRVKRLVVESIDQLPAPLDCGATSGGDSSAAVFPFSRLENGGFGGEVAMKNVPGVGATPGPSQ